MDTAYRAIIFETLTDESVREKLRRYWARDESGWIYRQKDLYDVSTPYSVKLHKLAAAYSRLELPGVVCCVCKQPGVAEDLSDLAAQGFGCGGTLLRAGHRLPKTKDPTRLRRVPDLA